MPSVFQSIQDTMTKITDQVGDLGPSPDVVDPAKLLEVVTSKVCKRTQPYSMRAVVTFASSAMLQHIRCMLTLIYETHFHPFS